MLIELANQLQRADRPNDFNFFLPEYKKTTNEGTWALEITN